MKIQIVTYGISRRAGGVFGAVCGLFTNKHFKSEDISIISFRDDMTEKDIQSWGDVKIQLFRPGFFLHSKEALKVLLSRESDLLHMECLWRWPQRWMTSWKNKINKPIVCSPHGMLDPWIIKEQGLCKRLIAKLFFDKSLQSVDCFHALCKQELHDIRQYGINAPIAVIPNGVTLPAKDLKAKLKTKKDSCRHLLYLGRIHPKKGVEVLLDALNLINCENSQYLHNWRIDIVGWGEDSYVAKVKEMCRQYHLSDYVFFHGGKFGDDKLRMLADSDAFILPSHGEGLPMSVLEAWSWNLPVLITPQCNLPEGISHSAAIEFQDDVYSCKDALDKLFAMSDDELIQMGEKGYELVSEHFTWDAVADKMIQLYKWLLDKGEKPSFVYET